MTLCASTQVESTGQMCPKNTKGLQANITTQTQSMPLDFSVNNEYQIKLYTKCLTAHN